MRAIFVACLLVAPGVAFVSTGRQRVRSPSLGYRELDVNDDDTSLLQIQAKAPPFYKVHEVLGPKETQSATAMNEKLIDAVAVNQAVILGIGTAITSLLILLAKGPFAFGNLQEIMEWSHQRYPMDIWIMGWTWQRIAEGVLGALPLLALSRYIEKSDDRTYANINFATIAMSMTLFGRRKAPPDQFRPPELRGTTMPTTPSEIALGRALGISLITGYCEEIVFRREVPAALSLFIPSVPVVLLLQAIIFGLGHLSPGARVGENAVLLGLQTANGLGFGIIYLLAGGDIVPCMIAHALYDFVTFFKTWQDANDQLEYAESKYATPLPRNVEREAQALIRTLYGSKEADRVYFAIKRLFYTFDFDKNESLSRTEVRKGIAYLSLERAGTPPPEEAVDRAFAAVLGSRGREAGSPSGDRLSLPDFVRLYVLLFQTKQGGPPLGFLRSQ